MSAGRVQELVRHFSEGADNAEGNDRLQERVGVMETVWQRSGVSGEMRTDVETMVVDLKYQQDEDTLHLAAFALASHLGVCVCVCVCMCV